MLGMNAMYKGNNHKGEINGFNELTNFRLTHRHAFLILKLWSCRHKNFEISLIRP